jgi:hypothetical protein
MPIATAVYCDLVEWLVANAWSSPRSSCSRAKVIMIEDTSRSLQNVAEMGGVGASFMRNRLNH